MPQPTLREWKEEALDLIDQLQRALSTAPQGPLGPSMVHGTLIQRAVTFLERTEAAVAPGMVESNLHLRGCPSGAWCAEYDYLLQEPLVLLSTAPQGPLGPSMVHGTLIQRAVTFLERTADARSPGMAQSNLICEAAHQEPGVRSTTTCFRSLSCSGLAKHTIDRLLLNARASCLRLGWHRRPRAGSRSRPCPGPPKGITQVGRLSERAIKSRGRY